MASIEAGSSSYDVFLSFSGDTRMGFTDHLYTAFDTARVHTFRDNKIPRGEEISSQLLEAIHGSEISIVVFSKGYATSTWCLDELANIMECRDTKGQVVLPVFYHIDPSDVRHQKRSFAEAFQTQEERFKEDMEKVSRWRKALREASTLTGWDLNSRANQHEAVFIEDIVKHVSAKLCRKYSLDVPKHLVGISSHVENIISLLRIVTDDTRFVNIHGMGGIGKTTLAKAVFNKLHREFEGSCFISNVNEHLKDRVKGLAELRIKILCDTLNSKLYSVPPESLVHIFMKENLSNRRVLVVLDDVVYKEHASLLVGDVPTLEADRTLRTESFKNMICLNLLQINGVHLSGCYSHLPRDIIWLCWHKSLLKSLPSSFRLHNLVVLDMQYSNIEKLESLDKLKILNLSHSKFAKTPNLVGLLSLERLILEHCERLAEVDDQSVRHLEKLVHLSLKDCKRLTKLPESICNLKSLETLDIRGCSRLEKLPDHLGAMESLTGLLANVISIMDYSSLGKMTGLRKISFYGCNNKQVSPLITFLLAPFSSRFSPTSSRLREISLSGCNNKQVSPLRIFLSAPFSSRFSPTSSTSKASLPFSLPASLNCSSQLTGLDLSYRGLSDSEIFIDLGSLSTLQELNLSGNKFFNLPSGIGRLPMLKYLLVKDCTNLLSVSELPSSLKELDVANCSALERLKIQSNKIPSLDVSGCKQIIEIEGMEGMGKSWVVVQALCKGDEYDIIIVHLSLKECKRLNNLPESICNLKSLETLDISGCSRLENLPENLGAMESLTELLANETSIMELPSSVGQLKRLRKISLRGCNNKPVSPFSTFLSALFSSRFSPTSSPSKAFLPASLHCSSQLTELDLSYRGLSDGEIFIDLGSLSTLQELNLSGNKFFNLPSGIGRLPMLKYLLVKDCTNLLSVSELPSSLKELDVVNCSALERLKIQSNKIPSLYVSGCKKSIEIERMEGMGKSWVVVSEDRGNLANNLKQSLVQALCKGDDYDIIIAADGEMPGLFSHRGEGSSLSFHVPPGSDGTKIQGLVVWDVCAAAIGGNICAYLQGEAVVRNKSTGDELFRRSIMLFTVSTNSSSQCSWVSHISLAALPRNAMKAGEELELSVEVKHTYFQVKKCGVHFIIVDNQRVE